MLHYSKSSLLRKQDMASCLGGPAQNHLDFEIEYINTGFVCLLCISYESLLWSIFYSPAMKCLQLSHTHAIILFLGDDPKLFWSVCCQESWGRSPPGWLPYAGHVPSYSWNSDQPGVNCAGGGGWREAPLPKFCISDTHSVISRPLLSSGSQWHFESSFQLR